MRLTKLLGLSIIVNICIIFSAYSEEVKYKVISDNPEYVLKNNFLIGFGTGASVSGFSASSFSEILPITIEADLYLNKNNQLISRLRQGFWNEFSNVKKSSNKLNNFTHLELTFENTFISGTKPATRSVLLRISDYISNHGSSSWTEHRIVPNITQLTTYNLRVGGYYDKLVIDVRNSYTALGDKYNPERELDELEKILTNNDSIGAFIGISRNVYAHLQIDVDKYGIREATYESKLGFDVLVPLSNSIEEPKIDYDYSYSKRYNKVKSFETNNRVGARLLWEMRSNVGGKLRLEGGIRPSGMANDYYFLMDIGFYLGN